MHSPEATVQLVIAKSERLIQYLNTLPPEAWSTLSACDRWEVRDVVAHLTNQGELYADAIARSLQGEPSPPGGRSAPSSVNAASDADRIAQRTMARRAQLGDQVLGAFCTTNDQLNRLLASLGPQDWEKPLSYVSLGIAPLTAESLPVMVDLIFGPFLAPPSWLFHPGPRLPAPLCYRWVLTGVGACEHDMVVAGDTVWVEPAGTASATVTFRCDTET